MEEENWSPSSPFSKAFDFITYASNQMSKSGDPVSSFIGAAVVWIFYFQKSIFFKKAQVNILFINI